jgi:hypothetical protein
MSISPLGNQLPAQFYSNPQSSRSNDSSSAIAGPADTSASTASTRVTLSADAQALASLNAQGITVITVDGPGLSRGGQPVQPGSGGNGSLSPAGFETVMNQFGASKTQADEEFDTMDADGSGSISNGEVLKTLGRLGNGSPLSQQLLTQMDTNGDGSVSGTELVNFETAVVDAEKA